MSTKSRLLVLGLLASALVLLSWSQEWFVFLVQGLFSSQTTELGGTPLPIGGQQAAPATGALALAGMALTGALAIAGAIMRRILGLIALLLGVAEIAVTLMVLGRPVQAAASTVSEHTGVGGSDSIAALVSQVTVSPWPWLAVAGGVLTVLLGVAVLLTASAWTAPSSRYGAVRLAADDGQELDWDSITRGEDPTESGEDENR